VCARYDRDDHILVFGTENDGSRVSIAENIGEHRLAAPFDRWVTILKLTDGIRFQFLSIRWHEENYSDENSL
jgi:hypothetical protein